MILSGGARTERVRFIGVDAPETGEHAQPFGKKSSEYAQMQLAGEQVWLQVGTESRDRYGRLLAYVWLEPPVSVSEEEVRANQFNARLLLRGYAQALTIAPNTDYAQLFRDFQIEAKGAGRGIWGMSASRLAKLEPASDDGAGGNGTAAYVGNSNSKKFHLVACEHVTEMAKHHRVPLATRELAIAAGYIPCRGCRP